MTEQEKKEIEIIVKDLILESILNKITLEDIKERGVAKFDVSNSILTDVMALGYNNNSKELAIKELIINSLFERQSENMLISDFRLLIKNRIDFTYKKFKKEIESFILMLKGFKENHDKESILINVKKSL